MSMPKLEPCMWCGHPRHAHSTGPCIAKTVTGPPSTEGQPNYETGHYEHIGRTVTPCPCTGYAPATNGAHVA